MKELHRDGVDVRRIRDRDWCKVISYLLEWLVQDSWALGKVFEGRFNVASDEIVVYGETMGFMKVGGKWKVFEHSDEPGKVDLYLYRVLIGGEYEGE